ncbi:MAG: extracellular solute-binding protein, partial [Bacteroidota bacterium]
MKFRPLLIAAALILGGCQNSGNAPEAADAPETAPAEEAVVNVYTHRHYDTDKALFKQFEEQTGIRVNVKKDGADKLIQLLQAEGANSPADLLITVDAGRLHYARTLDLLSSVASETLSNQVPANLCDPEGYWYALTKRARVIVYAPDRVDPSELSTYEDLASEKWAGRIFVRSSTNIYNQSLMASIIANQGEEKALVWAKTVVGNMAAPPKGNDR